MLLIIQLATACFAPQAPHGPLTPRGPKHTAYLRFYKDRSACIVAQAPHLFLRFVAFRDCGLLGQPHDAQRFGDRLALTLVSAAQVPNGIGRPNRLRFCPARVGQILRAETRFLLPALGPLTNSAGAPSSATAVSTVPCAGTSGQFPSGDPSSATAVSTMPWWRCSSAAYDKNQSIQSLRI